MRYFEVVSIGMEPVAGDEGWVMFRVWDFEGSRRWWEGMVASMGWRWVDMVVGLWDKSLLVVELEVIGLGPMSGTRMFGSREKLEGVEDYFLVHDVTYRGY